MITTRRATPADIPVLIDFQQRLAQETENIALDAAVLQQGLQNLMADPAKGFYVVAELDGAIAGCHMVTYEWSEWRNGTVWWLHSLYVPAAYRNRGVFRAMFQALTKTVEADPSLRGLRLYVDKTNDRAMRVYDAMDMNGEHYTVYEKMKS